MSHPRVVVFALLFAVLTSFGCSGLEPVPIEQFAEETVRNSCRWYVRCGVFENMETCMAAIKRGNKTVTADRVAAGTITYDPAAAAECLDGWANLSCDTSRLDVRDSFCSNVFAGTLQEGADCYLHNECVSRVCLGSCGDSCCAGTCAAGDGSRAPAGGSCLERRCDVGTYCTGGVCALLKDVGQACARDSQCDYGLSCYGLGGAPATCGPSLGRGDACSSGECDDFSLTCDPATLTCKSMLHTGEECDPGASLCSRYTLYCAGDTARCTRFPSASEPCLFASCTPGTFCDGDTCQLLGDEGQACVVDEQCLIPYRCNRKTFVCEAPMCA